MSQEVIYLIGDFQPVVLARWEAWAKLTNRTIQHITFAEVEHINHHSPILIMDTHGLNEAHLPGTKP